MNLLGFFSAIAVINKYSFGLGKQYFGFTALILLMVSTNGFESAPKERWDPILSP